MNKRNLEYWSSIIAGDKLADVGIYHGISEGRHEIVVELLPGHVNYDEKGVVSSNPFTAGELVTASAIVTQRPGAGEVVEIKGVDGTAVGQANHGKKLATLAMNTLLGFLRAQYPLTTPVMGVVDHPTRNGQSEPAYANQERRVAFFERFGFVVTGHSNYEAPGSLHGTLGNLFPIQHASPLGTLPAMPDMANLKLVHTSAAQQQDRVAPSLASSDAKTLGPVKS